jgi:hypothetical protein
MILTPFRHFLPIGIAATALVVGVAPGIAPARAQQAQRPAAAKPEPAKPEPAKPTPAKPAAGKPAATTPAGAKPATQAPAAQNPAPSGKPAAAKPGAVTAAPAQNAAPGGVPATLVASFADWGVYTAQTGRTKICYALTQPKDRMPKNLSRDPAYLFVSFRPAENVRNEVAFVMGFPTRDNGVAEATIGTANYALLTKEENAWLKNPAEEGQAITTMSRAQALVVKAQSTKGNQLTDRYSLNGFSPALERARKECS